MMRHQARAIFFARFVLGTRIVTFLAAGTFGVSAVRFALAEAAGSAIFVPAMATFGYLFADRALRIVHGTGRVEHWLVLGGLIGARGLPPRVAWLGGAGAARRRRPARLRSTTSRWGPAAWRSATIPASAALKVGAVGLLLMGGPAAVVRAGGAVEEVLQTPRARTTTTNITAPMNAMTMLPRKPAWPWTPRKLITMPPMNAPTIPRMMSRSAP